MAPAVVLFGAIEAPDKEALVDRNPHKNFAEVEASREDYIYDQHWKPSKTPNPKWRFGDGANNDEWKKHAMLTIDPNEIGRPSNLNYKLMISSTVPRPIALVSTVSMDGAVENIAPFSYFQAVCADPPLYSICFVGEVPNDSLRNVMDTKECCISVVSDSFIEAANATSINTPPHISEWSLSGLHPKQSKIVKPPHTAESAFSIELKYHSHQDIISPKKGVRTATLVLLEAVLFHVREDSIDKNRSTVDISKLRPVWRGGGITYGTSFQGFELPRPAAFRTLLDTKEVKEILTSPN
ncbi:uncharacterized protein PV09_08012 [Verruconis gallopava]|uniref:Flavin reductase like domain-containing protein n=1 Tax=Verruconis gallopava TaxID=253628 RepID=A0A0D1XEA0_9PEZI|nr:uncharacterized protein PV09_08012 [Verruconis gallopava]KIW00491.1 hypothetical protein PV09_08012 [Verruconis gallopava]